jgi:hypothetical protein
MRIALYFTHHSIRGLACVKSERPMNRTSILVCRDAGAAGRALLVRRDVELRWALTVEEALAALRRTPRPKLCLMRERFAADFLGAAKAAARDPDGDLPPFIVLLEPDGWSKKDAYFGAGATALAQHASEERILEAIASLTGLAFRQHPRVPYSTVIDVQLEGDRFFLESVDLSTTGVSVRGLPATFARLGERAALTFMMLEPPLAVSGVVTRTFEEHGEPVAAFGFDQIADESRARIGAIVDEETKSARALPDPVDMNAEIMGPMTQDLVIQLRSDGEANAIYCNMLKERLKTPPAVQRVPSWLERLGRALTGTEKRALLSTDEPRFALSTVELRIRLCRMRLEEDWPVDVECARALDVCQTLAVEARGRPDDVLADVTEIRAALLRSVYGDPKHEGLEILNVEDIVETL